LAKKFKFRLESILNIKYIKEDKIKTELGNLYSEEKKILNKIDFIESQIIIIENEIKSMSNFTIQEYKENHFYLSNLKQQKADVKISLKKIKKKIDATKERLVKAMKERKVLEALKENKKEEYKKEENLKMQKIMDELGITRFKKDA